MRFERNKKSYYRPKEMLIIIILGGIVIAYICAGLVIKGHFSLLVDSTTTNGWRKEDGSPPVIGTRILIPFEDKHDRDQVKQRQVEVVYALPENQNIEDLRGIALLLHGCSHSALKFFSPSEKCDTCIGLSEELRISRILLEQQTLAVVAITSQDRKGGCWSASRDIIPIHHVLIHMHHHFVPNSKRVLAFGASSGGRMAAVLAIKEIADAAFVGVMTMQASLVNQWIGIPKNKKKPPIYLAPMPRDTRTLQGNQQDFEAMKDLGPVLLDTTTCQSFPVNATYLNERVPNMKLSMATLIIPALVATGHLHPDTGMLMKDPTRSDWRNDLHFQCGGKGCLQNQPLGPGVSPLAKALHRAWAMHEYCSEATVKALEFFQKELGGPEFVVASNNNYI